MPEPEPFEFDILLWRGDRKVAVLPTMERGVYLELLFVMRLEQPFTGILSGTPEELARLARCSDVELAQTIHALKKHQTADVHDRNGIVTVINRKMNREHKARESSRSRVDRHRSRPSCNADVTSNLENTPLRDLRASKDSQPPRLTSKLSAERGSGGKPAGVRSAECGVRKCWTPFRPGTARELELLRLCMDTLGEQWPENSTAWGNRIYGSEQVTANPSKVERVMNSVIESAKESKIIKTRAHAAAHYWKTFA